MLADFHITIHSDPPRAVQVKVHESVQSLRAAAKRYDSRTKKRPDSFKKTLGVCHRFHWINTETEVEQPLCALVRLAPPNIGVGVISHEMAHAATWIHQLDNPDDKESIWEDDEQFCWNLGELVRQTVLYLKDQGVYDEVERRESLEQKPEKVEAVRSLVK